MLLFLVASLIIGGTVVGLSIHFTKMPITSARIAQTTSKTTALAATTLTTTSFATTTNKSTVKDHVLMLSNKESSNVPMVIGFDGESVLQFYCLSYNLTYHYCGKNLVINDDS